MTAAWSHGVYTCVLLFVQMERCTFRHLEIAPKDEPDLCRSTIFFSEILADLFRFSHDVKQGGTEFEGRLLNTSTGTPPIDSNDVRSFQSHDIIFWNFPSCLMPQST